MEIREAAVVGMGTMGAGIAEVLASSGIGVVAIDVDADALGRGMSMLDASLAKAVSRSKMSVADQADIRSRVRAAAGFNQAASVDLAIEVVPERMSIKRQIFSELDRVCSPDAILATNTSSLSVTAIAAATKHPGRVVGMHFFNPAPVMQLVEVVSTVTTADDVRETVLALCEQVGKVAVSCGDRAGFIVNALLFPYLNDAVKMLEAHYATADDIDI